MKLSLQDLEKSAGRDLQDAEKQTIDLMLQQIDLAKERQKTIDDEAKQERDLLDQGNLMRRRSIGQQRAEQIAQMRADRDARLKDLKDRPRGVCA